MVAAAALALTFPYGGKASTHRVPKTCILSEGEVVSMTCGCSALLNGKTRRFVGLRWIVRRVANVVVVILYSTLLRFR
jgi:hypothetical protein